ncbi:MAG: hypothetical protein JXA64_01105 [Candidatus Fermentibacteraceae bacterium]|nr:hypothetical protein [Candidatus Fermentibacteraceae bacterium]
MIRIFVIVCMSFAALHASDTGCYCVHGLDRCLFPSSGTDEFELSILNTFTISYASMVLGMDDADDAILFVDNNDSGEKLFVADPQDMSYAGEFDLPWTNADPFGVCYFGGVPYVNDSSDSGIRYGFDFTSIFTNPFGADGRGMDSDGTNLWEVSGGSASDGEVGRFNSGGSGFQSWDLPGITSQISGMTLYPIPGSTGIAVTTYDTGATYHYVWLYEFTGSQCVLLGTAELPSCIVSTGLAYSDYTGTWFSAFNDGAWRVIEFELEEVSFQQDTWGGIKSAF